MVPAYYNLGSLRRWTDVVQLQHMIIIKRFGLSLLLHECKYFLTHLGTGNFISNKIPEKPLQVTERKPSSCGGEI